MMPLCKKWGKIDAAEKFILIVSITFPIKIVRERVNFENTKNNTEVFLNDLKIMWKYFDSTEVSNWDCQLRVGIGKDRSCISC